jgi:hypothetical protein
LAPGRVARPVVTRIEALLASMRARRWRREEHRGSLRHPARTRASMRARRWRREEASRANVRETQKNIEAFRALRKRRTVVLPAFASASSSGLSNIMIFNAFRRRERSPRILPRRSARTGPAEHRSPYQVSARGLRLPSPRGGSLQTPFPDSPRLDRHRLRGQGR